MITVAADAEPGPNTTNEIVIGRTLAGRAAIRTVEKALEVAGGVAFYRSLGRERIFRDVRAARYHPAPGKGATALQRPAGAGARSRWLTHHSGGRDGNPYRGLEA